MDTRLVADWAVAHCAPAAGGVSLLVLKAYSMACWNGRGGTLSGGALAVKDAPSPVEVGLLVIQLSPLSVTPVISTCLTTGPPAGTVLVADDLAQT